MPNSKTRTIIGEKTVIGWIKELDPDKKWLRYKSSEGSVTEISCGLCSKHEKTLKCLRNISNAFIVGITGTALKKDNVTKHFKSDTHVKAQNLESSPRCLDDVYITTPIGRAWFNESQKDRDRVSKLIDISYTLAKEEIAFDDFPAIVNLEKRHGVDLGTAYHNRQGCKTFTQVIAEELVEMLLKKVSESKYLSILIDGATDTSVTEKELIYIAYISNGQVETSFFRLKNVEHANAEGLLSCIESAFREYGIQNIHSHLVAFCADGASVNLGERRGLLGRLRQNAPWVIANHCMNHRLELALNDVFKNTYLKDLKDLLCQLYYLYEKSPKKLR